MFLESLIGPQSSVAAQKKSQSHWSCGPTATVGVPHGNIKRLFPMKYVSFQPKLSIERIKSSVTEGDAEIYK